MRWRVERVALHPVYIDVESTDVVGAGFVLVGCVALGVFGVAQHAIYFAHMTFHQHPRSARI